MINFCSIFFSAASATLSMPLHGCSNQTEEEAPALHESPFPQRNDVTMRTLRFRDVAHGSEMDPFPALDDFHANRLEWVYLDFTDQEQEKIDRVKASGRIFGGAGGGQLKCWFGDTSVLGWRESLALKDLDGNPVIMPHKRNWNNPHYIGDVSNPKYLRGHIDYYKKYLEMGADTLQRDEVESVVFAAMQYGGGFTETGLNGFSKWLAANLDAIELEELGITDPTSFRYDEYLRDLGAPGGDAFRKFDEPIKPHWEAYWSDQNNRFFAELIREVKAAVDYPVTFSCNNTSLQIWEPAHLEFDFAISELLLGSANPRHIWERSKRTRDLGKFQIFGSPKTRGSEINMDEKVALTQKVIATAYSTGMASRVPWDIFQQTSDGSGRYFGKPEEYANLYAFVRAQDWSPYYSIRAYGREITNGALPEDSISVEDNDWIYAFLHQTTDDEPKLIHLVDWGEPLVSVPSQREMSSLLEVSTSEKIYFSQDGVENLKRSQPRAFTLILDAKALGLEGADRFTLLTPASYESLQAGESAVQRVELSPEIAGGKIRLEIGALSPWGVLEISN